MKLILYIFIIVVSSGMVYALYNADTIDSSQSTKQKQIHHFSKQRLHNKVASSQVILLKNNIVDTMAKNNPDILQIINKNDNYNREIKHKDTYNLTGLAFSDLDEQQQISHHQHGDEGSGMLNSSITTSSNVYNIQAIAANDINNQQLDSTNTTVYISEYDKNDVIICTLQNMDFTACNVAVTMLNGPENMLIHNNKLYVVNMGNSRITICSLNSFKRQFDELILVMY